MPVSDARKRASAKWNASKDNIMIRPDKETGAAIRAAAEAANMSNQQFILEAVMAAMECRPVLTSADSLPLDYAAIEPHIEKTGETVQAFVARAVKDEIARDGMLFKMGLKPEVEKVG